MLLVATFAIRRSESYSRTSPFDIPGIRANGNLIKWKNRKSKFNIIFIRPVIQPGMVLTVEPGIVTDYGTFHLEEDVLIIKDGEADIFSVPVEP